MDHYEQSPLYGITHPKSIAFWGASNNPMGMGSVLLSHLLSLGFEGKVYPMHPKETRVMGLRAYPTLEEVPGPVDLAVLVVPTGLVSEILEQCGRAGVKRAIVVSAGFAEIGPEGRKLQDRIVQIARQYGITFLGPNCIGVINSQTKLNTTFFPYEATPGFIGMASQSGSFVTQMFMHLAKFGLGFSQGISVGNEAVVDIIDCLEYLGQCPRTKVIALYIEAIRRGREFVRVAREVSKKKPIVAFYVGGSTAGSKAGFSHTGALAGPDLLYDAVFRQCGVLRASTIEELFDMCHVLGTQPLPAGDRVAVLTHSGGPGAAAADAAERSGLRLAEFAPETLESLRVVVPHTASIGNPVDLTFSRNPNDYAQTLPQALLQDPGVDMFFIYVLLPIHRILKSFEDLTRDPEKAKALADEFIRLQSDALAKLVPMFGKPAVGASFCRRSEPFIQELENKGFPVLSSPERAMKALGALARYARWRQDVAVEEQRSLSCAAV